MRKARQTGRSPALARTGAPACSTHLSWAGPTTAPSRPRTVSFEGIGTVWSVSTDTDLPRRVLDRIRAEVEAFDAAYSRFRPDSLVSALGANGGRCELPAGSLPMVAFYRRLYDVTNGSVSPLVGRALEHLGYDSDYSLVRRPGSAAVPAWDDVLTVDGNVLTASTPVLLDFGAAGKGYLVDLLAAVLADEGFDSFLIDGSGDLRQDGPRACRVGLEDPRDPTKVIGVANLHRGALCASATNRRRWGENLHHIVDPASGEPATDVLASWVRADTAMVADGLATALFLTDPAVLAEDFSFSYVRMLASGGVEYSTNFDGELFR